MNLHNFSAFFEFFAALNLGYAGSEDFRAGLNEEVLNIQSTIPVDLKTQYSDEIAKLDKCCREVAVLKYENVEVTPTEWIKSKAEELATRLPTFQKDFNHLNICDTLLIEEAAKREKFVIGFKSLFLTTGLFCLIVLVFEGYNQFYEGIDPRIVPTCLLFVSLILLFFNLYMAFRSFGTKNAKPLKTIYITVFLCVLVLGSILICKRYQGVRSIIDSLGYRLDITIAVAVATSAYFIHIARAIFDKAVFRLRAYFLIYRAKLLNRIVVNLRNDYLESIKKYFYAMQHGLQEDLPIKDTLKMKYTIKLHKILDRLHLRVCSWGH